MQGDAGVLVDFGKSGRWRDCPEYDACTLAGDAGGADERKSLHGNRTWRSHGRDRDYLWIDLGLLQNLRA